MTVNDHCNLDTVTVMESPEPAVGMVRGNAIGGALALLLTCDYQYRAAVKLKSNLRVYPNSWDGGFTGRLTLEAFYFTSTRAILL